MYNDLTIDPMDMLLLKTTLRVTCVHIQIQNNF